MNKKLFGFIFVFGFIFISFLLSTSNVRSASNVIISSSDVTSNSVKIRVTGIPLGTSTKIYVFTDVIETSNLYKQFVADIIGDSTGAAEASFSGLEQGVNYKAETKVGDLLYTISFKTPKVQLNLSTLNGMILEANNIYDKAVEGYAAGEYSQGSKARLSTAIKKAEHVAGGVDIDYTQSDIDNATRDITTALDAFQSRKTVPPSASTYTEDPAVTEIKSNGIVPKCNVAGSKIDEATGQYEVACDFTYFMRLINNAIKFLLFVIATPLIALIIMYTGYLYLTAGGNAGQVEKVKHILMNAVVGYVIALSAWLIVNTIVSNIKLDSTINTFLTPMDK